MSDITGVTAFKTFVAARVGTAFFFATLHGAGGSGLSVGTASYATGTCSELGTAFGYTQGGLALGSGVANSNKIDLPDAVWSASGGSIGPASYCAVWAAAVNDISGAVLVCVKDSSSSPQTATTGNPMTGGITDLIQF